MRDDGEMWMVLGAALFLLAIISWFTGHEVSKLREELRDARTAEHLAVCRDLSFEAWRAEAALRRAE